MEISQRINEITVSKEKVKPNVGLSSKFSASTLQSVKYVKPKEEFIDDDDSSELYGTPMGGLSYVEASTDIDAEPADTVDDILSKMMGPD